MRILGVLLSIMAMIVVVVEFVACVSLRKRVCALRPEYGECKGHRLMWAYDANRKQCRQFTYSNCGGNRNRFSTERHCYETCEDYTYIEVSGQWMPIERD